MNMSRCFLLRAGKTIKKTKNSINQISLNKTADKILFVHKSNKRFPIMKNIILMNLIG